MKILIVEDRMENVIAALEWAKKAQVEVVIKSNYESAKEMLGDPEVGGAILDLEIPEKEGTKPQREWGIRLAEEGEKFGVPYVILTGGYFHGSTPQAKVFVDLRDLEIDAGEIVPDKGEPQAWEKAYQALQDVCPNMEEIVEAKIRYKNFLRKPYQKRT